MLNKIAGHITDWDDITTFGLELDVELNTILQAKSDERTIKGATFKVIHSLRFLSSWSNYLLKSLMSVQNM